MHRAFFILVASSLSIEAVAAPTGGLPGSFTRFGVGSRALGMGGAFAGIADDATAVYWNPAGLSQLLKPEISATHISLFEDTADEFISYGTPLKRFGAIGASLMRQTSGGFEQRTNPFDSPTTFSINNDLYEVGWGTALPDWDRLPGKLRTGAALKEVSQSINGRNASSFGADLGFLYQPRTDVSVGLAFQNVLAPQQKFVYQPAQYPLAVDLVPTYTRNLNTRAKLTAGIRLTVLDGDPSLSGGLEGWYDNLLAVRFGMQERGVTTGIGIRFMNYQIDYAILLNDIGPSHIVSLGIRFGRTQQEIEAEIRQGIQKFNEAEGNRLAKNYYQQGIAFANEGNYSKASSYLESASLLNPDDKKIDEKLKEVKGRLENSLNQQMIERYGVLGEREFEKHNFLASREYWKGILTIDPDNEKAKAYIAKIESGFGAQERARLQAAQTENQKKQALAYVARAKGLLEERKAFDAFQEVKQALQIDPKNAEAKDIATKAADQVKVKNANRFKDATDLMDKKDYKQAATIFASILKEVPQYPNAMQKLDECRAAMRSQASPEAKKQTERLYYQAVDQYLKGNYEDCRKTLKQIFDLDPVNDAARKLQEKMDATLQVSAGQ